MKPVPRFHVFYPAHIPVSLGVHGVGHVLLGGLKNKSPSLFGLNYNCPPSESTQTCGKASTTVWQEFPAASSGPAFYPAVVSAAARKGIEAVWFGFHAPLPGTAYISIGEWSESRYPGTVICVRHRWH
jgi:hypothetical protein